MKFKHKEAGSSSVLLMNFGIIRAKDMKTVFLRAKRCWYLALFSTNIFSSRFYSIMSPLLRENGVFRLYPNRLIYLFISVFAFSSPFCYAKTAFSYSRTLLSPCTPDVTMVKNVVKFQPEMIDMWSCFRAVEAPENRFAGRTH